MVEAATVEETAWTAATARPKRTPHRRRASLPTGPRCQGESFLVVSYFVGAEIVGGSAERIWSVKEQR